MAKAAVQRPPTENRLLGCLPAREYKRLSPLLEAISLPVKFGISKARAPIEHVYFPVCGVISAMTVMEDGRAIEVATIGNEGMSGLTALVGGETSPYEVIVQVPGHGWRMPVDTFKEEIRLGRPLREILVRYHTAFSIQVAYSVACNGLHSIENRCCRWLLMTHDRVGSNLLPLTHEFLGIMLGARRASVTEVLHPLQKSGVIHNGRGEIEIIDRPALEAQACECYHAIKKEFARLFRS